MNEFDQILRKIRHPSRYLGCEHNAVIKDPAGIDCRVVLAYPDLYELAMSYLGLSVLYDALNAQDDLWAERVFAPDLDLHAELTQAGRLLGSLETGTALGEFDLVGFSLQHELNYPDLLSMLELGGIPVHAASRSDSHPFVIAGGPGAGNPEPLAQCLDAVFLGDAERGIVDVARIVGQGRRRGQSRKMMLDRLMELPGVYIPSRYRFVYQRDRLQEVVPLEGAPALVRRQVISDLEKVPPPVRPVVPGAQTVHERLTLEIQRGCTRGCRFCQAGMINRPVRQRSSGSILEAVRQGLARTGYDQVSFLSLSAGDHPGIIGLLEDFYAEFACSKISASLPSLRAETLTPALASLVKTVRKSGFTIAPEAGTDRLRRVINKQQSDSDVIRAAGEAFAAGWQLVKLYFMVGLPTETEADRQGLVELVARVRQELRAAGHRPRINVGISTFVPKPHTPFQWEAMVDQREADLIHQRLRAELKKIPGVKMGWTRTGMSWAEGLLSRGDRRQFEALEALVKNGQRLAGWTEHFSQARFLEAFSGIELPGGPDGYLGGRSPDEMLPWDHLDQGPSREFLVSERKRALAGEGTPDCRDTECYDCGACEQDDLVPVLDTNPVRAPSPPPEQEVLPTRKIRLRLSKTGPAVHYSHLEFKNLLLRALRRAGWPLVYSGGYHPQPKASFGPACPVGVESRAELVDVSVSGVTDPPKLLSRLEANLPKGVDLLEGNLLADGTSSIMKQAASVLYRLRLGSAVTHEPVATGVSELMQRESWRISRTIRGKTKVVDVRPSLLACRAESADGQTELVISLALESGPAARPLEIAREVCPDCQAHQIRIRREDILTREGGPV